VRRIISVSLVSVAPPTAGLGRLFPPRRSRIILLDTSGQPK
jgi:hypothetical protein